MKTKYACNDSVFSTINNPSTAWCLGFLYADGCVNKSSLIVFLSSKDSDTLDRIKEILNFKGDVKILKSRCQTGEFEACRLTVTSDQLTNDLITLGCTRKKSLTLEFPREEQVPKHLIPHFIRGYFDGDGSVVYRRSRNEAKVNFKGTEAFLMKLKEYLLECEISSSLYPQSNSLAYNLDISGFNNIVRFGNMIYDGDCDLDKMYRKFSKFRTILSEIDQNRKIRITTLETINF